MAAYEGGILVPERNVQRGAGAAALLRRGDQRWALVRRTAHRRTHFAMTDGGCMFQFAVLADGGSLAVGMRLGAVDAECGYRTLRQQFAEFLADGDQGRKVFDVTAGKGIFDHRDRRGPPRRRRDGLAHLEMGFLDHGDDLSDYRAHRKRSRSGMDRMSYLIFVKWMRRQNPSCTHDNGFAKEAQCRAFDQAGG